MKERDNFDTVAYAIHRINATVDRFLCAESMPEKRQAMKWARAWRQIAIRGPKQHSRNRPKRAQ